MDKLIMLLDIYEEEVVGVHSVWDKINAKEETRIISKEYGFIKWLVDNDKIDYHNKINYDISLAINRVLKKTTREERLLMMLAIQDEPIEFLISCLK